MKNKIFLFSLFTYFFCLSCTPKEEKQAEKNITPQENDKSKPKEVPEVKKDTASNEAEKVEITTEKGFNASETDLKDVKKRHEETDPKEPKETIKVVEVPKEVPMNPNVAEVVKEARAKYASVGNYHGGLALVKTHEGKYGYIDSYGKEILPTQYDFAEDLAGEPAMARVRKRDKVGYVGQAGKEMVEMKYRFIDKYFKGLAQAHLPEGSTIYIDKYGKYVCDVIGEYHEGIARIKKGDKIGYINNYGQIIVEPQYSYGTHFTNGQAEVKTGEKYKIINTKGDCVKDCN